MPKTIRLTKSNDAKLSEAVKGTLISANKAANKAIVFGLPKLNKLLGKTPKK